MTSWLFVSCWTRHFFLIRIVALPDWSQTELLPGHGGGEWRGPRHNPAQLTSHAAWRIRNSRERWHWADPGESSYKAGEQWLDAGIHHVKVKYKYSEITIQTTFNGFSLGMVLHCLPYTEKFRILIVLFSWLFRSLFECWCRKNFSLLLFPRMLTKWFLAAFYQNHLKWQILSAVNKKHRLLKQDKTFSWLMQ